MKKILLVCFLARFSGCSTVDGALYAGSRDRAGHCGNHCRIDGKGLLAGLLCGLFARKVNRWGRNRTRPFSGFLFALFVALGVHKLLCPESYPGNHRGLDLGYPAKTRRNPLAAAAQNFEERCGAGLAAFAGT